MRRTVPRLACVATVGAKGAPAGAAMLVDGFLVIDSGGARRTDFRRRPVEPLGHRPVLDLTGISGHTSGFGCQMNSVLVVIGDADQDFFVQGVAFPSTAVTGARRSDPPQSRPPRTREPPKDGADDPADRGTGENGAHQSHL